MSRAIFSSVFWDSGFDLASLLIAAVTPFGALSRSQDYCVLSAHAKRLNGDVSLPTAAKPIKPVYAHMPNKREGADFHIAGV